VGKLIDRFAAPNRARPADKLAASNARHKDEEVEQSNALCERREGPRSNFQLAISDANAPPRCVRGRVGHKRRWGKTRRRSEGGEL